MASDDYLAARGRLDAVTADLAAIGQQAAAQSAAHSARIQELEQQVRAQWQSAEASLRAAIRSTERECQEITGRWSRATDAARSDASKANVWLSLAGAFGVVVLTFPVALVLGVVWQYAALFMDIPDDRASILFFGGWAVVAVIAFALWFLIDYVRPVGQCQAQIAWNSKRSVEATKEFAPRLAALQHRLDELRRAAAAAGYRIQA